MQRGLWGLQPWQARLQGDTSGRRPTPAQRPLQMPEDSASGGVGRPPADDAAQEGQVEGQGH